ncbi:CPBP family intramembrane glutamic endopeptidase [Bremerella cremea]|uniref:CPBP family intramembrane glutamic endopeptidase n=1 Tax=Bremerella cremea TaxID=1031537 RepID=UPI001314A9FB|nr:CPBP family intramembrane glutamic endopeptidase [Bremerella cremea]
MLESLAGLAIFTYTVVLISTAAWVWLYVFRQLKSGQPILAQRSIPLSQRGATNIAMLVLSVLLAIVLVLNTAAVLIQYAEPEAAKPHLESRSVAIWAQMIIQSLICFLLAGTVVALGGASMFFGRSESQFLQDVRVGVLAFCALCVPVVIIQILVSYLTPYEHPLIDMMVKDPQWNVLVPVLVSAVLIAPVTEEFIFRLVVQGWLEDHLVNAPPIDSIAPAGAEEIVKPLSDAESFALESAPNPYAPPALYRDGTTATSAAVATYTPRFQAVPILISSGLFAMMHFGQGAAPIPLFFLALGLGYVFQRTRTMTASFVVHFMLNGQSMVLLLLQILLGDEAGTPPV